MNIYMVTVRTEVKNQSFIDKYRIEASTDSEAKEKSKSKSKEKYSSNKVEVTNVVKMPSDW